jgi:hypothetical protein
LYEIRCNQFREERGDDVEEEDDCFGDGGADEIEGCAEDYYVEDVVYKPC